MQGHLAPPRDGLTVDLVEDLIVGNGVRRGFGLDLLDSSNAFVEDISQYCRGWRIRYNNTDEVHGQLTVDLIAALPWGRVRVRPFYKLSKNGITARFNQGVYVLTTPIIRRGRTPIIYTADGQNVLHPLTRNAPDTYVAVADGTRTYHQALREVVAAAGLAGTVTLDGTRQDAVMPGDRVWALTAQPRWLDMCNDLLAEIAYIDLYADENGAYRSRPVAPLEERSTERVFDARNKLVDLLDADRTEEFDTWAAPNHWRGVARQWPTQPTLLPAPDGMYEFTNQSDGESSVDSVGLVSVTHWLDVADQRALEAEMTRIIEADRRAEREVQLRVDPMPLAGHQDVVEYRDDGIVAKMQVSSWELSTSGRGTWVLGGGTGGDSPEQVEQQTTATVTNGTADAGGLRVVVDGATTDSVANVLDGATYAVGQRITVTVRNPLPPLVQGVES